MNRKLRSFLRRRGATPDEIATRRARGPVAAPGGRPPADARGAAIHVRGGMPSGQLRRRDGETILARPRVSRRTAGRATVPRPGRRDDHHHAPADRVHDRPRRARTTCSSCRSCGSSPGRWRRSRRSRATRWRRAVRERRQQGVPDEEIATQLTASLDWSRLSRLIDYALRLQLRASARRKLIASDPEAIGADDLAVGFVDLVGYTALSQELEPEELGALVSRFEELAYDTVAEHGGPGRQDDRRRGHVRRRRRSQRGADRASPHRAVGGRRAAARGACRARLRHRPRPGRRLLRSGRQPREPPGGAGAARQRARVHRVARRPRRRPGVRVASAPQPPHSRHRSGRDLGARCAPSNTCRSRRRSAAGQRCDTFVCAWLPPPGPRRQPAVPPCGPRPPRRRGVEGRGHGRQVHRRGHPLRARVLHRRRGRRHPQPGRRHARRAGQPARGAHGGAAGQRRRHRVLVAAPARVPRLRHARHRDQRAPRQLRQRAARRGRGTARRDHPGRAAAGHRHLRRRPRVLPAPRPHPGARDLGAGVRRRRRPRSLSRGGRAVAAVEDVLHGLVEAPRAGVARGLPRARSREPVRALVRVRLPGRR